MFLVFCLTWAANNWHADSRGFEFWEGLFFGVGIRIWHADSRGFCLVSEIGL